MKKERWIGWVQDYMQSWKECKTGLEATEIEILNQEDPF